MLYLLCLFIITLQRENIRNNEKLQSFDIFMTCKGKQIIFLLYHVFILLLMYFTDFFILAIYKYIYLHRIMFGIINLSR